jgi:hypothetical protein
LTVAILLPVRPNAQRNGYRLLPVLNSQFGVSKMTINVTQADIDQGAPDCVDNCPIALAIIRAVGHPYVAVDRLHAKVSGREYRLPVTAQCFILDFDAGDSVAPFTFYLAIRDSDCLPRNRE